MRRSARITERGRSLLEVTIAAAIFSTVFGVALQQLDDATAAARDSTTHADLRRIGEVVLSQIVQDLRSTQARYVSASTSTLTLRRMTGFSGTSQTISLEAAGSGQPIYTTYTATQSTPDGLYQRLEFTHGVSGAAVTGELSREVVPGGFSIKAADSSSGWTGANPFSTATSGGLSLSGNAFADEPVTLAVQLALRRRIGQAGRGAASPWIYTTATLQTQVELRPSKDY